MRQSEIVPLKELLEKRYAEVLCYPRYDQSEARKRLEELKKLGAEALEFAGEKEAFDVYVLGKGYVGIVVVAYTDVGKAALKIRRVDADRAGMQHEAEMLKKANDVGVGPKLFRVAEDFLLMEFIEGAPLPKWVETLKGRGTRARVNRVLQDILEQCWRLDKASLDHGELSWAPKHVIVDVNDKPFIVDFETASNDRRVSNVTSICQYIFLGSRLAKTMKRKLGDVDTGSLIHCLRDYKQERTRENFEKVLIVCGLK